MYNIISAFVPDSLTRGLISFYEISNLHFNQSYFGVFLLHVMNIIYITKLYSIRYITYDIYTQKKNVLTLSPLKWPCHFMYGPKLWWLINTIIYSMWLHLGSLIWTAWMLIESLFYLLYMYVYWMLANETKTLKTTWTQRYIVALKENAHEVWF